MTHRITTFQDLDRWLGHIRDGRATRHVLLTGPPGKGKTARIRRFFRNSLPEAPDDPRYADLLDRRDVPIYQGHITPAKAYVRAWQHRDDDLVVFNDIDIRPRDLGWEGLLLQLLEEPGERMIRWDLKGASRLSPVDQAGYASPWAARGQEVDAGASTYGEDEVADEPGPGENPFVPSSFVTRSQYLVVANGLGQDWDRIRSRLRCLEFDPSVGEMIGELARWCPVPAITAFVASCYQQGEVLSFDFRTIENAVESYRCGENWEDELAANFVGPGDDRLLMDIDSVLGWLQRSRLQVDAEFTEHDLYDGVQVLRPDRKEGRTRRERVLRHLVECGMLERFLPSAPARRGRPRGPSYRVCRLD
jgi:hypothetical protein